MPPGPSVARRPAAVLDRKPTAALDWRRKSDRATRWRNRFAIRILEPAFVGLVAHSRANGIKRELWMKLGIACGCSLQFHGIPVDSLWIYLQADSRHYENNRNMD